MPEMRRGLTVTLTRAVDDSASLARELRERGARVLLVPCVRVMPLEDTRDLASAINGLTADDQVVLTSRHGAEAVRAAIGDGSVRAAIVAVGEATASLARSLGLEPAFVSREANGTSLGRTLPLPRGSVLLARSDRASADLPKILAARGAGVREIIAYRTVPEASGQIAELRQALAHETSSVVIVVASPSAVDALAAAIAPAALRDARFVAIGESTAARLRERLAVSPRVSERPDDAALRRAVTAVARQAVNA